MTEPGLLYVERTLLISGEFMPRAEPRVLDPLQMAADIATLLSIDRENATESDRRKMEAIDRRNEEPKVVDTYGIWDKARCDAEWLAKSLGLTPVATAARTTYDEPLPSLARGYTWQGQNPFRRFGFAQGCALATWEPVTYPGNGDWTWGPGISDYLRFFDTDIQPREHPKAVTLTDPLADLRLWVGVTTELRLLRDWTQGLGSTYNPTMLGYAIEALQAYRRGRSGGKPMWEADLRPEPLRNGEWTMFVCRASDKHLIPAENLTAMRAGVS